MNNRSNQSKGAGLMISGVLGLILGIFMISAGSPDTSDWRYYWDSDYRNGMEFLHFVGIVFAVSSVIEIIAAIVFFAMGDTPSSYTMVTCLNCGHQVSRTAMICPVCHMNPASPPPRRDTYYNPAPPPASAPPRPAVPPRPVAPAGKPNPARQDPAIWKPAQLHHSAARYCPACGKSVSEDNSFCMNCGKRVEL